MCMTCGCNTPNDDHGDARNIVLDDFRRAAAAGDVSVMDAILNPLRADVPLGSLEPLE